MLNFSGVKEQALQQTLVSQYIQVILTYGRNMICNVFTNTAYASDQKGKKKKNR